MSRKLKVRRFECLENRWLLAGNITVVENGDLFIRGDEHSNQIEIVADDNGRIEIRGLSNTTINGSREPYVVTESQNLDGQRGRNASFDGGLKVFTGHGNDRIDIEGLEIGDDSRINTGTGHDVLRVFKSTTMDDLVLGTGKGNDSVMFVQTRFRGDLNVRTHSGSDDVRMQNSRTWDDTNIVTGDGHDDVKILRSRLTGDSQRILANAGHDSIEIKRNEINESGLEVLAGHGRDQIFAAMGRNDKVSGSIVLNGQAGFDALSLTAGSAMQDRAELIGFEFEGDLAFDNGAGGWGGVTYAVNSFFHMPNENHRVASDFELESDQMIRRVTWTGSYGGDLNDEFPEPFEKDDFTIEFFEGNSLVPIGDPIATFQVGDRVNRIETGVVVGASRNIEIFAYDAEIDLTLEGGKTYWISIYSSVEDEVIEGTRVWGHYNTFRWGMRNEYLYELNGIEIDEATAYTYGDRVITEPGWAKTDGGVYDFQLWS